MPEIEKIGGISSAAVQAKTGKTWDEWLAILDEEGAQQMKHPDIARLLQEKHGVPDWWCQMITVGYEQARGMREVYQTNDGYSASASRTIEVPLERVFAAWAEGIQREKWLPGASFEVRKATANKSMRITWEDGSNVDVEFYPKGEGKSQVAVQHTKLPDAESVAAAKTQWREALGRLKSLLERG